MLQSILKFIFLFALSMFCNITSAQKTAKLFDDKQISEIHISIDPDTLKYIINNKVNDIYSKCTFVYNDLSARDTLEHVGFRLKGNTALNNQKKSFKLSFNTYEKGRKYQGVKKINLLANVNDPTMIRQMLYYYIYERCGLLPRRGAFVKVYINNEYRGLYTNLEEPDDEWIEDHFESDKGNLYKCTYPADLTYQGPEQSGYKNIFNDPVTRAYDLKTNEDADDYSDLVELISFVNKPNAVGFSTNIHNILNIRSVLKTYAVDIATGNWDDYFYLKNNYYLYKEPSTGQFHYAAYDTDNTFGIDWLGIDWLERDALKWYHQHEPRPLISSLLNVPEFKQIFINYLDSVTNNVTLPDSVFPKIDEWHALITSAAEADTYRPKDYGYSMNDFHNAYTKKIDNHTPYGLKPFLEQRRQRTRYQLTGLATKAINAENELAIYPNPGYDEVNIIPLNDKDKRYERLILRDINGKVMLQRSNGELPAILDINDLESGVYFLELNMGKRIMVKKLIKV